MLGYGRGTESFYLLLSWISGRFEKQVGYDLVRRSAFMSGRTIRLLIQQSCVMLGFSVHVCLLQLFKC